MVNGKERKTIQAVQLPPIPYTVDDIVTSDNHIGSVEFDAVASPKFLLLPLCYSIYLRKKICLN